VTPRGPQGRGCPTGPAIPSGSPASLPGQRVHDVGIDRPHQVVPPCAEVVAWPARFGPPSSRSAEADSGRPRPGPLRLPARPAAARAGPAGHPGLAGRRGSSPLWLGVPGGAQPQRAAAPPGSWPSWSSAPPWPPAACWAPWPPGPGPVILTGAGLEALGAILTERRRSRLAQDQVRAAGVGEARVIAAGRVEAVRILQTNIDATTCSQARELVAGIARPRPLGAADRKPAPIGGPAGAVASRGARSAASASSPAPALRASCSQA
jgi:hypothetical protein